MVERRTYGTRHRYRLSLRRCGRGHSILAMDSSLFLDVLSPSRGHAQRDGHDGVANQPG
jgi:hypothetical protein